MRLEREGGSEGEVDRNGPPNRFVFSTEQIERRRACCCRSSSSTAATATKSKRVRRSRWPQKFRVPLLTPLHPSMGWKRTRTRNSVECTFEHDGGARLCILPPISANTAERMERANREGDTAGKQAGMGGRVAGEEYSNHEFTSLQDTHTLLS